MTNTVDLIFNLSLTTLCLSLSVAAQPGAASERIVRWLRQSVSSGSPVHPQPGQLRPRSVRFIVPVLVLNCPLPRSDSFCIYLTEQTGERLR